MTAQQLKNSILQMAVQGKLVPQDPNDESASVLLERIRVEKERLIREKKIKREKNPSVIFRGPDNTPYEQIGDTVTPLEVPFEIPESWEWVRLGSISTYAETRQKVNATNADPLIWGLDLEDIEKGGRLIERKTVGERKAIGDKTVFAKGDILYSKLRPYLLKTLVAPDNGICSPEIVPFRVYGGINPEYIVHYLKSPCVDNLINSITYGVKMPRVGTETMTSLLVPVPPLGEQHRIVEKIEELLPTLEKYGDKESELSHLSNTFPEALKKSILQQAVQGKLVPQDPAEEPAAVLLKRIRSEKQRLVKEGKIKKDKHESVIFRRDNSHYELVDGVERCIDEELPFEIPESWGWTRASFLGTMIRGKGIKRTETTESGMPCIRYGEIYTSYDMAFEDVISFIPPSLDKSCPHFTSGDVVFTLTGENKVDIAKAAAFLGSGQVAAGGDLAFWTAHGMNPLYLVYYMACPYCIELKRRTATGDIIVHISTTKVGNFLVPVPPLSEQHRIVAQIEELLPLIQSI